MRDRLHVFSTVAEKLNFTQAAQALFMTQPAVSAAIKALEAEYGVPLLSRAGGRVELTEAGRILYKYAQEIHELEENALRDIRALSDNVQGRLTIGASTTIAQYVLPKLLGEFAANYPQVSFSLVSLITEQIAQLLEERKIDFAIVEGEVSSTAFNSSIWIADELQLNTADTPDAPDSITFEELVKLPLLMREKGSGHRQIQEQVFRSRGVELSDLNIVLELGSTEAVKLAVENGLGLAFLSDWSCKKERALGSLKVVSVPKFRILRHFHILQSRKSEETILVQRFIAYMQKAALSMTVAGS
jgi:Transcriptional regulator